MSAQRISQRQGRSFSHHLMPMVALLSPISTWAAPPVPYGSWTRNAITGITAPCPTGYKCDINVKDRGILQRVLTDPQGQRYIQLIVDDGITRNNSQMTNESFVQGGGTSNNGIATKQHVSSSGATQLTSDVTLAKGWANNGKEAAVLISQSLFDNTNKKPVVYSSTFDIALHYAANTQLVTGSYMAMRQDVTNSTALNGATRATGRDVHSFVSRRASGDFVAKGAASLPAAANGMMGGGGGMMGGGGGPTGGSVSWNAGDAVQVDYIGQVCEGCASMGMMGGGGMVMGGGSAFAFQQYDNLSDSSTAIATRSLLSTSPINWVNPPFGAAPSGP